MESGKNVSFSNECKTELYSNARAYVWKPGGDINNARQTPKTVKFIDGYLKVLGWNKSDENVNW